MPEFAAAIQEYVNTATTLEVALAAIGILALATAFIGWIARLVGRNRKSRRARRTSGFGGSDGFSGSDPWGMENGIVFPAGSGANEFRPEPMQFDDDDEEGEASPVGQILAGGLDEIMGTGERVVEAVRERPLEFIAGALAAGFAVGLVLPLFNSKNRTAKLLERLLEDRSKAERESDRFRQARQK